MDNAIEISKTMIPQLRLYNFKLNNELRKKRIN